MQEKNALFNKSVKQYKENISVLQAVNIIYITIIFMMFVLGLYFLGIWVLGLGMLFLPMFSVAYNFICLKIKRNEEIKASDIFRARKVIFPVFSMYYRVYKKPLLWSVLAFVVSTVLCSTVYVASLGLDTIMSAADENGNLMLDTFINTDSYIRFTILSQILCIIISYFVFTLTRQKYQFIPLILQNGNYQFERVKMVGTIIYDQNKKEIRSNNLKFLAVWLLSLLVGSLAFYLFDKYQVFLFDVNLLLSIFIFLFIGSFTISIKVLYKNNLFYYYILPGLEEAKAKNPQKNQ